MLNKKKSQAAFEFLTTYGWAMLLIIITIGALSYFGIFNPMKFLPDRCNLGTEFACREYSAKINGLNFRVSNNIGQAIIIDSIDVEADNGPIDCTSTVIGSAWDSGEAKIIPLVCDFPKNVLVSGQKEKFSLKISYHNSKSTAAFTKSVDGEVFTSIGGGSVEGVVAGTSCKDALSKGFADDGVYTINPSGNPISAYCDMTSDEGGWTMAAVCKASDANCWNENAVGAANNPQSPSSVKLSDADIKSIMNSGDKFTRTSWRQDSQWGESSSPPYTAKLFNLISSPNEWDSYSCGSEGKQFYMKKSYGEEWGSPISTVSSGCACAANGWSNVRGDSCEITWYAGCEAGPSMTHCCACAPIQFERADLVVWVR